MLEIKATPELLRGDPHDRRIVHLEDSDSDSEDSSRSESHLTSPLTFSLIDTPISPEVENSKGNSFTDRLAKGFQLWMNKNADMSSRREGKCRAANTESLDACEWDVVKSEDS
ncbi:hypothetical protein PM082_022659 [Marasmius tenuissimus]|nr:hypothetical protein PM082_022659 [Marasmius tenuissimus]